MADTTTATTSTPLRTTLTDIRFLFSPAKSEDRASFAASVDDGEQDEATVGELLLPEEVLEGLRPTSPQKAGNVTGTPAGVELDEQADVSLSASSASSSSPSTPEQSLLLSHLAARPLQSTPRGGLTDSPAGPSTPIRLVDSVQLSNNTPARVPQSELSIARNIPLPPSPYLEDARQPPSSPLALPQSELSIARNIPLPPSPLPVNSPARSELSIACQIPLPPSPAVELPQSELSIARNIPLPLSPSIVRSPANESRVTGEEVDGEASLVTTDLQAIQTLTDGVPITPSKHRTPSTSATSVELGRGLRELFAASPGARVVPLIQETSVDFLVPIGGDSSISLSMPHPPSVLESDISMSSLLNAVFPPPASISQTDSNESFDILRTPAPPEHSGSSSSDMAVPTVEELLHQTAFTFSFVPSNPLPTPITNRVDANVPALRLSEVIRPEAFLPTPHRPEGSSAAPAVASPFPKAAAVLADKLLALPIPTASHPSAASGNTTAPLEETKTSPSANVEAQRSPTKTAAPQEPPSTPRTSAPDLAGARKPKCSKRSTNNGEDRATAPKKHTSDKEEKKRKRKEEVKDFTALGDKENAAPVPPRLTRSASSRSAELSSKLVNAVAATTAANRSPLKPSNGAPVAAPPSSPTKNVPLKPSKPAAMPKPAPTSKLPTAAKKRSALPVPTAIPRPAASRLAAPGSSLKTSTALKTSVPVPPIAQRVSVAVPTAGSPSRSLLSSGAMRVPSPKKPARSRLAESAPASALSPAPTLFSGLRGLAPPPPFGSFDFRSGPFAPMPSPAIRNLGSPVRVMRNGSTQEVPLRKASSTEATETKRGPSPPNAADTKTSAPNSSSTTSSETRVASTEARPTRRMPTRQAKTDSPLGGAKTKTPAPVKGRVASMKKPAPEPASRMPAMSEVELRQLTAKNTRKNEQVHSQMEIVTVYRDMPRPPSPSSRIRTVAEKEKEERKVSRDERAKRRNAARGSSDTEEIEQPKIIERPLKHARGPGDDEDYSTPASKRRRVEEGSEEERSDDTTVSKSSKRSRRSSSATPGRKRRIKAVRWDKALIVPPQLPVVQVPSKRSPSTEPPANGCLKPASKEYQLDALGNIPEAGQTPKDVEKQRIKVAKFIYNDDAPESSTASTRRPRKAS